MCIGRCLECTLENKPCVPGKARVKVLVFGETGGVEVYLGSTFLDLVVGDRFEINMKGRMLNVPVLECNEVKKEDIK